MLVWTVGSVCTKVKALLFKNADLDLKKIVTAVIDNNNNKQHHKQVVADDHNSNDNDVYLCIMRFLGSPRITRIAEDRVSLRMTTRRGAVMGTRKGGLSMACLCISVLLSISIENSLTLSSDPKPTQHNHRQPNRRRFFSGAAASAAPWVALLAGSPEESSAAGSIGVLYPGAASVSSIRPYYEDGSWAPPSSSLTTKLARDRILASELSPLGANLNPFESQELYYPSFLFGSWNVTSTLKSKKYPFGLDVVPSNSLKEGSPRNRNEQVGDATSYEAHYFSTLANTISNQVTVNLGLGSPKPEIIADRAFNAISLSKAYKQLTPVQEVDWDYRKEPTKLTVRFGAGPLAEDMRPLGERRGEVFLNARSSEDGYAEGSGVLTYGVAERSRAVNLAPGNVVVSDTETITEFRKLCDDHVTAVSRIAVYLTPNPNSREGVLWQEVGGKAVAFFDYELDMTRLQESFTMADGTTMDRACVSTPKDVVQCW